MNKLKQFRKIPLKTCSLCKKSTETEGTSLIYFGEWMSAKDITVHYYCLLLATHLPQRGKDHGGILGFLLLDIRHEISRAKNRKCKYCSEQFATIKCFTCDAYFHLTCGHTSKCLSQFVGDFRSYCHDCIPKDQYKEELIARKQISTTDLCFICAQMLGNNPKGWIYAKCCGNGFTHSKCMKIFALSAGYYLRCIWCKDKQFREDIKYQGIFVPDRDANWEREKGAYSDLYRRHKRCDMETCYCPRGRHYTSVKWQFITCKFCGAFGAHNPFCIPGYEASKEKLQEFKCDICSVTERTGLSQTILDTGQDLVNSSLYVGKNKIEEHEQDINFGQNEYHSPQETQMSELCESAAINTSTLNHNLENMQIQTDIYNLTQSQPNNQKNPVYSQKVDHEEGPVSDYSNIADLLVQKVLDAFEVNSACDANKVENKKNDLEFRLSQETPIGMITKTAHKPVDEFGVSASSLKEIGYENNMDLDANSIADFLVQRVFDAFEVNSAQDKNKIEKNQVGYEFSMPQETSTETNFKPVNEFEVSQSCWHEINHQENSGSDVSSIADLLVQKVLDAFEVNSGQVVDKVEKKQHEDEFNAVCVLSINYNPRLK